LFEAVVERCLREGLVGGDGFAVDASLIAADANKQRSIPGDQWRVDDLGADAGQAVREYLATLDDAAFGAASEVTPKFISPSDPAAQWTGAHKGHAFFAYATNYLIDTENAVILDVEWWRHCHAPRSADPPGRGVAGDPHLANLGMPILRTISGVGLLEGGSFSFITPKVALKRRQRARAAMSRARAEFG
jgi:hypothetical protein